MQAIKSSHSSLEDLIVKSLWNKGFRFRRNVKDLTGCPDIAIKKYKIVIFIDSCFWHGCEMHFRMPKTNKLYWENKILKNIQRDKEVTEFYNLNGWNVIRVWEHQIKNDFRETLDVLITFIKNCRV